MPQEQSSIQDCQRTNLKEPNKYKVIIHNDDFTTMEFVVMILKQVFFYTDSKAEALMLQVHNNNSAIVGIYTYDIAITRAKKATRMARENSYPLRLTVEAE
ncbi:MAG: ATP-dependent Clp protease adaptor ClpS [Bacteroidaceae bacterium]|nr:ATP-dependent Clp protease adaptor ClpS [Bacteroidaceae bacterium]